MSTNSNIVGAAVVAATTPVVTVPRRNKKYKGAGTKGVHVDHSLVCEACGGADIACPYCSGLGTMSSRKRRMFKRGEVPDDIREAEGHVSFGKPCRSECAQARAFKEHALTEMQRAL